MKIKYILKLFRIHQWIKNIFIFIPLVFSGLFININSVLSTSLTALVFCLGASLVYIINDINDVDHDKNHPQKKERPIASGKIQISEARIIAFILLVLSLSLALFINIYVFLTLCIYIIVNLFYTFKIKNFPIWDIVILSFFYIIRIYAGGFAIDVPITSWLLLTAFFATLFIGAGKRYVELASTGVHGRKVLKHYSKEYLIFVLYITSLCTILFYSIYALTRTLYFQISTVFVVIGFLHYFYYLFKDELNEDPVLTLLKKKEILGILTVWLVYVLIMIGFRL